jgi:hypothetical protein
VSLASLQARLDVLRASLPPTCEGASFLQHGASGWRCLPIVSAAQPGAACHAAPDAASVVCDSSAAATPSPPDCLPPGGVNLAYSSSAGDWRCTCAAGYSGPSCTVAAAGVTSSCAALPACSSAGWRTGLYAYNQSSGAWSCACAAGWSGQDCSVAL